MKGFWKYKRGQKREDHSQFFPSTFKSNAANNVGARQKQSKAFRAINLSNSNIHYAEGIDFGDSEGRTGSQESEPMALSKPTLQVEGQSVSPWVLLIRFVLEGCNSCIVWAFVWFVGTTSKLGFGST